MPVQDGDQVLGINTSTGGEVVVTIPPTSPSIRPIVADPDYGPVTLLTLLRYGEWKLMMEYILKTFLPS